MWVAWYNVFHCSATVRLLPNIITDVTCSSVVCATIVRLISCLLNHNLVTAVCMPQYLFLIPYLTMQLILKLQLLWPVIQMCASLTSCKSCFHFTIQQRFADTCLQNCSSLLTREKLHIKILWLIHVCPFFEVLYVNIYIFAFFSYTVCCFVMTSKVYMTAILVLQWVSRFSSVSPYICWISAIK